VGRKKRQRIVDAEAIRKWRLARTGFSEWRRWTVENAIVEDEESLEIASLHFSVNLLLKGLDCWRLWIKSYARPKVGSFYPLSHSDCGRDEERAGAGGSIAGR